MLWDVLSGIGVILIGVFPALVMMLGVKLALIPVVALRSLDTFSVRTKSRPLFDWIMARDQHLRMYSTVRGLLQCARTVATEGELMAPEPTDGVRSLLAREELDLRSLMAEGELSTQELRAAAERENRANLAVMVRHLLISFKCALHKSALWAARGRFRVWILRELFQQGAGVAAMCCLGLAALSFLVFVLTSAMLPVVCVVSHVLHGMCEGHFLETALSCVYLGLLGGMACLAPSVVQFECFSDVLSPIIAHAFSVLQARQGLHGRMESGGTLDLDSIKRSYNGWLVGCQIQTGLVGKLGSGNYGIPDLVHLAGKSSQRGIVNLPLGAKDYQDLWHPVSPTIHRDDLQCQ
eukprot:TRINITY_DN1191_c0_g1_i10.p1 TRINITY_DN1191_c0_g1~~TRINITY_DN1191_c0_g1_i10.p1  ORF type:complete len:351 (-),score=72.83 TRINITY_DN1191_c0_g1_i10:2-1054(-)